MNACRCRVFGIVLFLTLSLTVQLVRSQNIVRPFPITLPTRDTSKEEFLPSFPTEAAGSHGALGVSTEGHIVALDGTRLKLFGTTLWNTAQFLSSNDAKTLALRLRKLGFNAVHFAFNDATNYDDGSFFKYRDSSNKINKSSYTINPLQLGKFDTLFAEFKKNGIYTVFTFMSSHRYFSTDGVMYSDSTYANGYLMPFLDPTAARLELEWARFFLSHRNSLTGIRYADDPAMAIVEFNYEASLYWYWNNTVDRLVFIDQNNYGKGKNTISYNYSRRLDTLWNSYLIGKYGSDVGLKNAWAPTGNIPTKNFMDDASFENPFSNVWSLQSNNGALAVLVVSDGGVDSQYFIKVRISDLGANPTAGNVAYGNLSARLGQDSLYEVSFWAKMGYDGVKSPGKIKRNIQLSVANYNGGSRSANLPVSIDTSWKQYKITIRCTLGGLQRVNLLMGAELGDVWLDAFSVKAIPEQPPGSSELLSNFTVKRQRNDGTLRAQPLGRTRDLIFFYDSLEKSITAPFMKMIKDTLHFKGLVNTRQNSYWQSLPDIYAESGGDVMDFHQGNDFIGSRPSLPYSDSTWMVRNNSSLRSKSASYIPQIAAGAVKGKPIIFGDFQVPWMNQNHAEHMLLLPAWGCYQDWDGIFFSPYAVYREELFADSLMNPFHQAGSSNSIANNPAIMALAPFASKLFREGLVGSAGYSQDLLHDENDVWLLPVAVSGRGTYGVDGSLDNNIFTQMKVRQSFNSPKHKLAAEYPYLPDTATKKSDTGELLWDQTNGLFTVSTPLAYAASGFFGRDSTHFPSFSFSRTDGAAQSEIVSLYLMSADSTPLMNADHAKLVISTRAQNSGLSWVDSLGFGKNWGKAPTVLSAATINCNFSTDKDSLIVNLIDGTGKFLSVYQKLARIPGSSVIHLVIDQASTHSVWYDLVFKKGLGNSVGAREQTNMGGSIYVSPNPATTGLVRIYFSLPRSERARLILSDDLGRIITELADGEWDSGGHSVEFHAESVRNGQYTLTLLYPGGIVSKQLNILR